MADDDDKPDTGATDSGDTGDATGQTGKDWQAEAEKWKALARKHEANAKANAGAAAKLATLEEADKTEIQKLTDRVTLAEKRAEEAETKALRAEVAGSMGLTAAQAKRLVGSTEEELRADAAELLESFGGGKKADDAAAGDAGKSDTGDKGAGTRRPTEKLRPGAAPADTGDKPDPKKIAAEILGSPF
jgi:hypothetical protein